MSVWVIPLERMTFQKYSWCSKILQFDVRLIFREQSYSLHRKNKHWNFILLIFHQREKLWVNYTSMRKKKKNQSKSSKWQPNHNCCKQNSQLSNEPNILWDVVKHTSTFVLEGYFWQSFTHRFTWPAQLTNISHLTVPLLVFTPVIDFPSVIMDSTATFSKILTPNEKKSFLYYCVGDMVVKVFTLELRSRGLRQCYDRVIVLCFLARHSWLTVFSPLLSIN